MAGRHRLAHTEGRELRRTLIIAIAQSFLREVLVIILRELWRGGPWT